MKKREYEKLVLDTTTLATKTQLAANEIEQLAKEGTSQINTVNERIVAIRSSISKLSSPIRNQDPTEHIVTATTNKRLLQLMAKELTQNIAAVAIQKDKQSTILRETYEKLLEKKVAGSKECEFDLVVVQNQLDKADALLKDSNNKLQSLLHPVQIAIQTVHSIMRENNVFLFEQGLQDAMKTTTTLSNRIASLEESVHAHPDLITRPKFVPLLTAVAELANHANELMHIQAPQPGVGEAEQQVLADLFEQPVAAVEAKIAKLKLAN